MSFAAEFVPPGAREVASKQEVREGDYVIFITSRDVETVGRVEKCEKARVRIAGDPTLTGSASSGWQDRSSIRRKLTAEERGRQEEKEEAHKASLAVARKSDLSDLRGEVDGHFEIPEPADRGMMVGQLQKVLAHIERRLAKEKWRCMRPPTFKPETVAQLAACTMYDAVKHVVLPATVMQQCTLVELMATVKGGAKGEQLPSWFVSQWWGEPVVELVACITTHEKDRKMKKGAYWVCACAHNQWKVDIMLAEDPAEASFHKVMSIVKGTLTVVDKDGVFFSRTACLYESYVTMKLGRAEYLWDIYSAGCQRKEIDVVVAAGLTDGLAEVDAADWRRKNRREAAFPLTPIRSSVYIALETSAACKESDRLHILNRMIGSEDLSAPLPGGCHPTWDELNHALRGKFAAAFLRKVFMDGALIECRLGTRPTTR